MSKFDDEKLVQIRASMAETNELFDREVFGNRNFDAFDEIYTQDAKILPPGAPLISGRAAIKDFWVGVIQSVNPSAAKLTTLGLTVAGDGLVEIGKAVLTIQPPGQPVSELEVKYVVFWREENQRWKWHIDIWNTNA